MECAPKKTQRKTDFIDGTVCPQCGLEWFVPPVFFHHRMPTLSGWFNRRMPFVESTPSMELQ